MYIEGMTSSSLPSYIGIIISQEKDPLNESVSRMELLMEDVLPGMYKAL